MPTIPAKYYVLFIHAYKWNLLCMYYVLQRTTSKMKNIGEAKERNLVSVLVLLVRACWWYCLLVGTLYQDYDNQKNDQ